MGTDHRACNVDVAEVDGFAAGLQQVNGVVVDEITGDGDVDFADNGGGTRLRGEQAEGLNGGGDLRGSWWAGGSATTFSGGTDGSSPARRTRWTHGADGGGARWTGWAGGAFDGFIAAFFGRQVLAVIDGHG